MFVLCANFMNYIILFALSKCLVRLPAASNNFALVNNKHHILIDHRLLLGIYYSLEKFQHEISSLLVNSNRDFLIGPLQDERSHIMVTLGEEAIANERFINDILKKGTTIVRINCAHGNPSVWSEIIKRVKISSQMLEKPCRILMDLAGLKLLTGRMKPSPCVMKISAKKNASGNVVNPAQVWVAQKGAGPPPAHVSPDVVLYVDGLEFITKLDVGDTVRFRDARVKQRSHKILKKFFAFNRGGFMADCPKTCYVQYGTELYIKGNKKRSLFRCVVDVPPIEAFIRLKVGDSVNLESLLLLMMEKYGELSKGQVFQRFLFQLIVRV